MKMELRLRPAREDEREALGALKLRASLAWGDHSQEVLLALPGADELAVELLPDSYVVEIGRRVVGFATLVAKGDLEAEVEELFVEPGDWRRGVGTRLVQEAVRRAVVAGARRLIVSANPRAEGFYEACGFQVVGEAETLLGSSPLMQMQLN
jgi:ribosomal protein S18 acetylase RimI-like enzyme